LTISRKSRRKDDWLKRLVARRRVDRPYGLFRLVFGIYKWQSHLPKLLAGELRDETVTKSLGRDTGLIRNEEYDALNHR
jgi:hypothetical protein